MRANLLPFVLGLVVSATTTSDCQAMELAGPARVVDGDTLEIGTQTIRIHGIDAPEASQICLLPKGTWDCSSAAVNVLRAIVEGKEVRCAGHEFDQYRRLIAHCATDEVPDIGAQLVASGLAWAFIKYSNNYAGLEKGPRAKRIGIWQSKTQPPWEYRARRWETATKLATEGCPIKGNINAKGERIYHAPWSKHYARTKVDPSKGERWFCTEAEAKAAGWRAPYR
jgi:endonuclease YncB( thermonuclease family)